MLRRTVRLRWNRGPPTASPTEPLSSEDGRNQHLQHVYRDTQGGAKDAVELEWNQGEERVVCKDSVLEFSLIL